MALAMEDQDHSPQGHGGGGLAYQGGAIVRDKRTGQFATGPGLTEQQADFVRFYVLNGGHSIKAAEAAGYAQPQPRAWELMRNPAVLAAIREEQARTLYAEVGAASVATILAVMRDPGARNSDKVAAARLGMEAAKLIKSDKAKGENPLGSKALADMNMDELETFIAAGNAALANKRQPVILDGNAQDSAQSAEDIQLSD